MSRFDGADLFTDGQVGTVQIFRQHRFDDFDGGHGPDDDRDGGHGAGALGGCYLAHIELIIGAGWCSASWTRVVDVSRDAPCDC
jgi:hypothetical protein